MIIMSVIVGVVVWSVSLRIAYAIGKYHGTLACVAQTLATLDGKVANLRRDVESLGVGAARG